MLLFSYCYSGNSRRISKDIINIRIHDGRYAKLRQKQKVKTNCGICKTLHGMILRKKSSDEGDRTFHGADCQGATLIVCQMDSISVTLTVKLTLTLILALILTIFLALILTIFLTLILILIIIIIIALILTIFLALILILTIIALILTLILELIPTPTLILMLTPRLTLQWVAWMGTLDNEIDLLVTLCGILQFQEKYPMDGSMDSFGTACIVFWDIRAKKLSPNSWGLGSFLFALGQSICHTSTHSCTSGQKWQFPMQQLTMFHKVWWHALLVTTCKLVITISCEQQYRLNFALDVQQPTSSLNLFSNREWSEHTAPKW